MEKSKKLEYMSTLVSQMMNEVERDKEEYGDWWSWRNWACANPMVFCDYLMEIDDEDLDDGELLNEDGSLKEELYQIVEMACNAMKVYWEE